MIFPFWIYRQNIRDKQGIPIEFVEIKTPVETQASDLFQKLIYTNSLEHLFLVQSLVCQAIPGAGQLVQRVFFVLQTITQNGIVLDHSEGDGGTAYGVANEYKFLTNRQQWAIPAGAKLYVGASFNSGVAANSLYAYMTGWKIPRGEVSM